MIETRLLRNALMLAEHRNFARAAKALNISQPTLSRSIQLLEKTVGERLFDRTSRTILPTQAGEILLKHARIILSSSEAMQEEIGRHKGILEGSLCIGSGPYPASALLAPAIGRFCKRYPGIHIDISVDDWRKIPNQLMQKDFDYVVMETSQLDASRDFELTRLNRHPGFFFCRHGHPLLEKENLTISDLSQFPLILTALPKRLSDLFDRLFFPDGDAGASSGKLENMTSNDLATIKATVSQGDAISLGTYGALALELEAGLLVALPFYIPELESSYDIVKRKGLSLSPAAWALIEILIETDQEQSILETDLIESLGPAITS
ncbi:MAG: LysR family transcriptional regulator [Pseudomonadota bacterium]|nr:LysR family transcriptional regulator [Pseudomonadota bacterium]